MSKDQTTRLYLLAHAPTAARRAMSFPVDESIEPVDPSVAKNLTAQFGSLAAIWRGLERRNSETAAALGLTATPISALAGWSVGSWAGAPIASVAEHEPTNFEEWRTDPNSTPGGGESLSALLSRVAGWLDQEVTITGRALVIADPAVVRAALVHALNAGPATFWRLDVAPLSLAVLQRTNGEWRIRGLNIQAPL